MEGKGSDEGRQSTEESGNGEGQDRRSVDAAKKILHSFEKTGEVLVGDGGDRGDAAHSVGLLEIGGDGLNHGGGVGKRVYEAGIASHQYGDNLGHMEHAAKPPSQDQW